MDEQPVPSQDADRPLTVVHIFSASYSGSTWLNLALGSHPDAFSVGEVKTILKIGRPVCTVHGEACGVWPRMEPDPPGGFYRALERLTGKRIFVVNNSRKWMDHERAPGVRAGYIHLLRDGRAVVASRVRKGADASFRAACGVWKREVRRNAAMVRRHTPSATVYYERLMESPDLEFPALCRAIGIEHHPSMLEYWKTNHCFLGGNRGTLHSMLRVNGRRLAEDPEADVRRRDLNWDLGFYEKADPRAFRDERWREELAPRQRRLFALFAGWFNRRLGY